MQASEEILNLSEVKLDDLDGNPLVLDDAI